MGYVLHPSFCFAGDVSVSSRSSQGHVTRISPGHCRLLGDPAPLWPRELSVRFASLQRGDQSSLCSGAQTSAAGDPSGTKGLWLQCQHKCQFADSLARATHPMQRYPLLLDNATCTLPCPKDQRWPPRLPKSLTGHLMLPQPRSPSASSRSFLYLMLR